MKYMQLLNEARKEWKEKITENEWYFAELRELFLKTLNDNELFQALNDIILIIISEKDTYFSIELLELFFAITKKNNSSEIPIELLKNKSLLDEIFRKESYQKNLWEDIKKFYFII